MKQLLITIAALVLVGCTGISKKELLKDEEESPIIFPASPVAETTTRPRASIHRSARQGEVGYIIQHINAGTDVNEVNKSDGQIALHSASTHNHLLIIKILIDNSSNVNLKDKIGMTPLHLTALGGHKEATKIIIDSGALLNIVNIHGKTALDVALKNFEIDSQRVKLNKKEIAELLRQHGGKTGEELKAAGN
jgi:ankyrin repeat protein